jgi:hypothetical protein
MIGTGNSGLPGLLVQAWLRHGTARLRTALFGSSQIADASSHLAKKREEPARLDGATASRGTSSKVLVGLVMLAMPA